MSTELSPSVCSSSLDSIHSVDVDENVGLENGVVRTGSGVLTELDRVSPSYYLKRENMPTAYGGYVDQNGNTTDPNSEVNIVELVTLIICAKLRHLIVDNHIVSLVLVVKVLPVVMAMAVVVTEAVF